MTANLDEGFNDPFEGIDIVIPDNKTAGTLIRGERICILLVIGQYLVFCRGHTDVLFTKVNNLLKLRRILSPICTLEETNSMGKITGLGGVFIKASDPQRLAEWYERYLGIDFNGNTYVDFPFPDKEGKLTPGSNVLSFFKEDSPYFHPSTKPAMLNLRVSDLNGLLERLKKEGVEIVGEPMDEEYGKFGWIMDPEGNKIELWEPPAGQ
jgi:predicted enzyme related to lactoylglutathione lyase